MTVYGGAPAGHTVIRNNSSNERGRGCAALQAGGHQGSGQVHEKGGQVWGEMDLHGAAVMRPTSGHCLADFQLQGPAQIVNYGHSSLVSAQASACSGHGCRHDRDVPHLELCRAQQLL